MWIFVKKFDFLKKISGKIEHLDPDPEYGSGCRVSSPNEYGSNPDPKPWFYGGHGSYSFPINSMFFREEKK